MFQIKKITALKIGSSRAQATLEATVYLTSGAFGTAAVPSGASTGSKEACALPADVAVANVLKLGRKLKGRKFTDWRQLDIELLKMDGTDNKEKLGANAILAISLAFAKACAAQIGLPFYKFIGGKGANLMPVPMMNVFNGGKHGDNGMDVQECMFRMKGFNTFTDAFWAGVKVYNALKDILKRKNLCILVGDEGGFSPAVSSTRTALMLMQDAVHKAGFEIGEEIDFTLDAAISEVFNSETGLYNLEGEWRTNAEVVSFWEDLCKDFCIGSIEDGLDENDWAGWRLLTQKIGDYTQLVGDDLFVTQIAELKKGINNGIANAILIKPNQVGSLTETINTVDLATRHKYKSVMSHRSGETEDVTISHLAVALNCGQIKTGAPARTDRVAKFNELLRIEQQLGKKAIYAGAL